MLVPGHTTEQPWTQCSATSTQFTSSGSIYCHDPIHNHPVIQQYSEEKVLLNKTTNKQISLNVNFIILVLFYTINTSILVSIIILCRMFHFKFALNYAGQSAV